MEEYGFEAAEQNERKAMMRHRPLAIASVVLGAVSCFCCFGSGFGVIPAVIAVVFAIISIARGGISSRKLGWIGLITGILGLILNAIVIAYMVWAVRWDMLSLDRLATIRNIDPNDETELYRWLQQFFRIDLSGLYR